MINNQSTGPIIIISDFSKLSSLELSLTLFYMGFLGVGNAWGGAESARPFQNVCKAYLSYEIDVEQLFSALLLDTNSLRGQNYHFG